MKMAIKWMIAVALMVASIIFIWNGFGLFSEENKVQQPSKPLCIQPETRVTEEEWTIVLIVNKYCKGNVWEAMAILVKQYEPGKLYIGQLIQLP